MIFADNDIATGSAVLAGILATVSTFASGLFAWLGNRDKLRFDAKLTSLNDNMANMANKITDCEEDRKQLRQQLQSLTREVRNGGH